MFTINQGFDLNSPQFNFKRDYFANIADLKAAPETSFPDHFITNVAGVLYQLTKSNSVDATTGKWRKVQLGSDVDLSNYAQKSELNKYNQALKSISFNNGESITGTSINNTIVNLGSINEATDSSDGLMSANDKAKLDGIAVGANKYVLPVASATALGGIKLGSGLSASADGTVRVSSDVVAGSVEWNNIKNKPNVAILDRNNEFVPDGGNISTLINGNKFSISYRSNPSMNYWQEVLTVKNAIISTNGIVMFGGGDSHHAFTTNGKIFDLSTLVSTSDIQSISEDELNKILV